MTTDKCIVRRSRHRSRPPPAHPEIPEASFKQDDDVPIFLMMPIADIRVYCDNKANAARRSVSPMPNFTE
ncbi:unnamed protein product [Plutella xylostella]|uniref:(diamondback moth) hypothetical protein n=1 Tax=Plutella xylostella TaxID=51655 RepID=A0A8S4EMW8_PLUXY|nr:unnamed protein product [Plutella xylostella]